VLQGGIRGMVRREIGIEVAQDSDADGVTHESIVLDQEFISSWDCYLTQEQQVPPLRFRFPSGTENSGRDDKFLIWNKKNLSKENSLEEMREFEQAVEGD
jgi:hypothetical protein